MKTPSTSEDTGASDLEEVAEADEVPVEFRDPADLAPVVKDSAPPESSTEMHEVTMSSTAEDSTEEVLQSGRTRRRRVAEVAAG